MINTDYVDDWRKSFIQSETTKCYFKNKPLSFNIVDNGIILPFDDWNGGVFDSKHSFIECSRMYHKNGQYKGEKYDTYDDIVIYLGNMSNIWGHCLTDNLKYLWFLHTQKYLELKQQYPSIKLVYICSPSFHQIKNFNELLKLAGISSSQLNKIEKPSAYSKIIVPDPCIFLDYNYIDGNMGNKYYTREYINLIDKLSEKIESNTKYRNIYLSRSKLFLTIRDIGEKDIERSFKKHGFHVVYPEKLSLTQQIALYKGAEHIATTEGSIAHNAVFMSNGCKLTIIRKSDYLNSYQVIINQLKNLKVTYVDAHLSVFVNTLYPYGGPFFLYVNDNLIRYFNDSSLHNSFSTRKFLYYTKKCIETGQTDNKVLSDSNYYKKLNEELLSHKRLYTKIKRNLVSRIKSILHK